MDWVALKDQIELVTGLPEDALHIYFGVLIQLTAALLLRRPIAGLLPWIVVLFFLLVNEWIDLTVTGVPPEPWQIEGSLWDIVNTMLLPSALLLIARFAPGLLVRNRCSAAAPASDPGPIGDAAPDRSVPDALHP